MLELLKKLGVPATVAAVVAALITLIPIFFKLDERYAKEADIDVQLTAISKQINALSVEVGQMAGTTQVLVTIVASSSMKAVAPTETTPLVITKKPTLNMIPDLATLPPTNAGSPSAVYTTPTYTIPVPLDTTPPKTTAEKRERLDQVTRSLEQTQERVRSLQQMKK